MTTQYQVKVYEKDGLILNKTISPKDIISEISFSSQINGGQGDLNIEINDIFESTEYLQGNIVEVKEYSDFYKSGRNIYKGYISRIERQQDTNKQTITLVCLGLASLLGSIKYNNITVNQDPAQTLKDIIDYFNTKHPNLINYGINVENYGSSINIKFENQTCLECINNTLQTTNFYRFIDSNGELYFKLKSVNPKHYLTNKKDIESINIIDDIESLVNYLYVERNGGVVKTYQDVTSQNTYGVFELFESKTDITNESSQDEYGNNYILENKDPKKQTSLVVNNQYDLGSLNPGDTIKVKNFNYSINNLQIKRVSYSKYRATLDLEDYTSFGKLLTNN